MALPYCFELNAIRRSQMRISKCESFRTGAELDNSVEIARDYRTRSLRWKLQMSESCAAEMGGKTFAVARGRCTISRRALAGNAYSPRHICTRVGNVTYLSPRIYLSHRCEMRENFYPPIGLPRSSSFEVDRRGMARLSSVRFDSARRNGGDGRSLSSFFIGSSQ